jgi:glutaminyl-peptide cyclotransferase
MLILRSGLRVVFMLIVLLASAAVITAVLDLTVHEFPDLIRFTRSGTPGTPQVDDSAGTKSVPSYSYTIITTYTHDPEAFTEGLVYQDDVMYEGTGLYGSSTVRKTDLINGNILMVHGLPPEYFGEGLTVLGDDLYQLTYQSRTIFVYDKKTLELIKTVNNTPNGWGLTDDGARLIMSEGSSTLYFLDPASLVITGRIDVQDRGMPVSRLNELEYVEGEIFANIWQDERIARISPRDGTVTGWIDLNGLTTRITGAQPAGDLNGIAYDAARKRLFVTGKFWPEIVEIGLIRDDPPGTIPE